MSNATIESRGWRGQVAGAIRVSVRPVRSLSLGNAEQRTAVDHASLALQAGVHVKVVSERLGHSSVGITLDTYSHAIPAMDAEAAVRVMEIVKTA